jgi:hypothetical protein
MLGFVPSMPTSKKAGSGKAAALNHWFLSSSLLGAMRIFLYPWHELWCAVHGQLVRVFRALHALSIVILAEYHFRSYWLLVQFSPFNWLSICMHA